MNVLLPRVSEAAFVGEKRLALPTPKRLRVLTSGEAFVAKHLPRLSRITAQSVKERVSPDVRRVLGAIFVPIESSHWHRLALGGRLGLVCPL